MEHGQMCEVCEERPAEREVPGGFGYGPFLSCLECNPGSPDILRENGWQAEAWEEVR